MNNAKLKISAVLAVKIQFHVQNTTSKYYMNKENMLEVAEGNVSKAFLVSKQKSLNLYPGIKMHFHP